MTWTDVMSNLPVVEAFTLVLLLLIVGGLASGLTVLFIQVRGAQALTRSRREAQNVMEEARQEAQTHRRQAELEAREQIAAKREAFEQESQETRNELYEKERQLNRNEDELSRKLDTLTTKQKSLDDKEQDLETREAVVVEKQTELERMLGEQRRRLLELSGLDEDEARKLLLQHVEQEVEQEAGRIVQRTISRAEDQAKEQSRRITLAAIQRFAAEHTSSSTVTTIDLPAEDMKGRVIGREGRNIRAFEKATGADVIVDNTPNVVVVSCFDPVRRATAADAMQRLVSDGRIQPSRIEETVEHSKKEMCERITRLGNETALEANVHGLHENIVEMMGRLHFRTSYGQNILRHSVEVAYLSQVIADELGLDGSIARRAGFLHDIGKAMDHEKEGGHPAIGMRFCKRFNEPEEVLNAVGGHHSDIESTTPYTPIVMAADAISGARPGARRETLERYVQRLEQLESIAKSFKGVREAHAVQAGREVRVIVDAKRINDAISAKLARDIANRVEQEMTYPGEVRVTVLREVRNVEVAK